MSEKSAPGTEESSDVLSEILHFSGKDGRSGLPLVPPLTRRELAERIRALSPHKNTLQELRSASRSEKEPKLETRDGFDELDLAEAGWGIIFPENDDGERERNLRELIEHRQKEAGQLSMDRFQVYRGERGYTSGLRASDFRELRGGSLGAVDPDRMPYYLLLVGGPEEIPFHFQYGLDIRHAVGRVSFETPQEYEQYAASIVEYERSKARKAQRELTLFASKPPADPMAEALADGLMGRIQSAFELRPDEQWRISSAVGDDATRETLSSLLAGENRTDLLFSACHGIGYDVDDPDLREGQGAVLCQPASGAKSALRGKDLGDGSGCSSQGLISVLFGCYSGGTPSPEDGPELIDRQPPREFRPPFVAHLPQRLLARECGGALAVIAHVGLACGFSFYGRHHTWQISTFEDLLRRLMAGETVGRALELFNLQYAELASELWQQIDSELLRGTDETESLINLYVAMEDARRFVVLGDPAARFGPVGGD